jgi:hypothetical protein
MPAAGAVTSVKLSRSGKMQRILQGAIAVMDYFNSKRNERKTLLAIVPIALDIRLFFMIYFRSNVTPINEVVTMEGVDNGCF